MEPLEEIALDCPYCGERITLLIDHTVLEQTYVEDCQVCCQPMVITASLEADSIRYTAVREND